ncbi:MAG: CBS domain-containing protein [Candidatus Zixiibacteriota bacterium]
MIVRDILDSRPRAVVTTDTQTTVIAAMQLLINNKISCLPVVSQSGELQGIVSERDIFRLVYDNPAHFQSCPVGQIMSTDVITASLHDDVDHIASLMTQHRFRHVPILEGNTIVGLISIGDVVKVRLAQAEDENRHLHKFIDGNYPA